MWPQTWLKFPLNVAGNYCLQQCRKNKDLANVNGDALNSQKKKKKRPKRKGPYQWNDNPKHIVNATSYPYACKGCHVWTFDKNSPKDETI